MNENKYYEVELTEKENGYCDISAVWDSPWQENTESVSEEEAVDLCRDWLIDHGDDPEKYVFRARAEGGEWVNI